MANLGVLLLMVVLVGIPVIVIGVLTLTLKKQFKSRLRLTLSFCFSYILACFIFWAMHFVFNDFEQVIPFGLPIHTGMMIFSFPVIIVFGKILDKLDFGGYKVLAIWMIGFVQWTLVMGLINLLVNKCKTKEVAGTKSA